jgi:hypothetical protein
MEEIKLKHFLIPFSILLVFVFVVNLMQRHQESLDQGLVLNMDEPLSNQSNQGPALGSALGISAETSGSSPESGATSRLKSAYDILVALGDGYGNEQPYDYPYTHSTYWQRILYAAFYSPPGTATESDVLSGKTFYSQYSRELKTGTSPAGTSPGAYYEQYVEYDDYKDPDYQGEESTWTNTNALSGSEVWYDTRTGLYWSYSLGNYTNSFSSPSSGYCGFFDSEPRGTYDGSDADCGNAINACGTLSLASTQGESADTDWYLPTQKELDRAYVDGINNQAGSTFTTTSLFWSSTEYSGGSTYAWYVDLHNGHAGINGKTFSRAVRCVRRD